MRKPSETSAQTDEFDAVVIGAGFAGIHAPTSYACSGFAAGCTRPATASVAPGTGTATPVRCDSESWFYCFTFSDELLQNGPGRSDSPAHDEIRRYLDFVTDRLGLRPDMQFGTRVTTVVYDDESARWRVETDTGDRVVARYVISAVGSISATNVPEIPGLETFTGRWRPTPAVGRTTTST